MSNFMYYRVSNRRGRQNNQGGWQIQNNIPGRWNKQGGSQKSPKVINREVGINGEAGKNTAIRNFIEIKSSSDLVKISTIGHLASSEHHLFCCIFDESEGTCFAILNRKNHSQHGKIHATQKNA